MKADMTKEGALCVALRCVALRIREQLETCLYYLFSLGHANIVMMPLILYVATYSHAFLRKMSVIF